MTTQPTTQNTSPKYVIGLDENAMNLILIALRKLPLEEVEMTYNQLLTYKNSVDNPQQELKQEPSDNGNNTKRNKK